MPLPDRDTFYTLAEILGELHEQEDRKDWTLDRVLSRMEDWEIPVLPEGDGDSDPVSINQALNQVSRRLGGHLDYYTVTALRVPADHGNWLLGSIYREICEQYREHGHFITWRDFFGAAAWCPLFGPLPEPGRAYPGSTGGRAIEVIRNARELIEVYPCDYPTVSEPIVPDKAEMWPDPSSTEFEPWYVEGMRILTNCGYMHIWQNAPFYAKRKPVTLVEVPPEDESGSPIARDQVDPESVIHFARRVLSIGPQRDEIKDHADDFENHEIYAALAITEAYHVLWNWLWEYADVSERSISRRCQVAEGLLYRAKVMYADAQIEANRPDTDRGQKAREAAAEGGRTRGETFLTEREQWLETAEKVRKEYRTRQPSKRELARRVAAILQPDLPEADRNKLADSRRKWL